MAISVGKAIRALKNDKTTSLYFLLGNDSFLQSFFIKNLKLQFKLKIKPTYLNLNDERDVLFLLEKLTAISFFSSKEIYVLRNFTNLPKKNQIILESYLKTKNFDNLLIFVLDDFRITNTFAKKISKESLLIDIQTPFYESKKKEWVNYYLKNNNYSIENSIIDFLIQNYGDDLSNIFNEIEKIFLYKEDIKNDFKLEKSDYNNRHIKVWHLMHAIGEKKTNTTINIFENLLLNGTSLIPIIINLSNFYISLLSSDVNYNNLNKIIMTRLPKYKKLYTKNEIMNIILELRNLDIVLKTTSLSEKLLFTPFIIKICKNYYV